MSVDNLVLIASEQIESCIRLTFNMLLVQCDYVVNWRGILIDYRTFLAEIPASDLLSKLVGFR
jgi:hypothetical protein